MEIDQIVSELKRLPSIKSPISDAISGHKDAIAALIKVDNIIKGIK